MIITGALVVVIMLILGTWSATQDQLKNVTSVKHAQTQIDPGARVYQENCAACHGERGGGGNHGKGQRYDG